MVLGSIEAHERFSDCLHAYKYPLGLADLLSSYLVLCSENARLKSEKNEQRRQLREEIERKDAVIKR